MLILPTKLVKQLPYCWRTSVCVYVSLVTHSSKSKAHAVHHCMILTDSNALLMYTCSIYTYVLLRQTSQENKVDTWSVVNNVFAEAETRSMSSVSDEYDVQGNRNLEADDTCNGRWWWNNSWHELKARNR